MWLKILAPGENASIQASACPPPCPRPGWGSPSPEQAYTENDANTVSQVQLRHDIVLIGTLKTEKLMIQMKEKKRRVIVAEMNENDLQWLIFGWSHFGKTYGVLRVIKIKNLTNFELNLSLFKSAIFKN